MFSLPKLVSFASVAFSAFVAVTAAPVESRDVPHVWVTVNQQVTTAPGDSIWLTGNIPELKNWAGPPNAVALNSNHYTASNRVWSARISLPANTNVQMKYIWKKADGSILWEAGKNNRVMHVGGKDGAVTTSWNQMDAVTVGSDDPVTVRFEQAVRPASGQVLIVGGHPKFGNWDPSKGLVMNVDDGVKTQMPLWNAQVTFNAAVNIQYKFVVKSDSGAYIWEGGPNRVLKVQPGQYDFTDIWRDDAHTPALTGPGPDQGEAAIFFLTQVKTNPNEKIYIVGNIPQLGAWNPAAAIPLSSLGYTDNNPFWWTYMNVPAQRTIQYKFIKKSGDKVTWEGGANHIINTEKGNYSRAQTNWQQ